MTDEWWWLKPMFLFFTKPNCAKNIQQMDIAHMEWDVNLFMNFKIQIKKRKKKRRPHNLMLRPKLLLFQRNKKKLQKLLQNKTLFFNRPLPPEVLETSKLLKHLRVQQLSSETF